MNIKFHTLHPYIYIYIIFLCSSKTSNGTHPWICYSSVLYGEERPDKISGGPLTGNAGDIIQIQMFACASS